MVMADSVELSDILSLSLELTIRTRSCRYASLGTILLVVAIARHGTRRMQGEVDW